MKPRIMDEGGILRVFLWFLVVVFLTNLVWESSHLSLYGGYENLSPILPVTFWSSLGDVFYALVAVFLISLIKKTTHWIVNPAWNDFAALAFMGFLIALFVEYKALALGRWYYLETMPIIPFLKVGLSPVIQMTLLLPFSLWVAKFIPKCKPLF